MALKMLEKQMTVSDEVKVSRARRAHELLAAMMKPGDTLGYITVDGGFLCITGSKPTDAPVMLNGDQEPVDLVVAMDVLGHYHPSKETLGSVVALLQAVAKKGIILAFDVNQTPMEMVTALFLQKPRAENIQFDANDSVQIAYIKVA